MCESHQNFTLTRNVGLGLLLCPTPPAHQAVGQPSYVEISSQGVMSSKKVNNYPGLHRIKGY